MPGLLYETLQRAHDGELALQWKSAELTKLREQLRRAERCNYLAIAGAGLLVAAAVSAHSASYAEFWHNVPALISVVAGVAGIWLLLRAWPHE
jgi:hypothetical protein